MDRPASFLSRVRGVELLPGERVGALLNPDAGLVTEPPNGGRLLVTTDRRFINIFDDGDSQVREIYSIFAVSGISIRNDRVHGFSWKQWISLIAGGIIVYVALAYWLVERLPPIIIPGLNLHAFALIIMFLVVIAGWLFWRGFTQPGGRSLRISGTNWEVETRCAAPHGDLMSFAHSLSEMQSRIRKPCSPAGSSHGE